MKQGRIRKMRTEYQDGSPIIYGLPMNDDILPMNDFLGKTLKIQFEGEVNCVNCDRKIKKSFSQGYCYPCFQSLPETDMCIVRPEVCHFDKGTCRDSEWGKKHCFVDHTIYLANSSGAKVGITRSHQQITRWMDQGAIQALPIARVSRRLDAGTVEVAIKQHVSDKTNWRTMLKGGNEPIDLKARAKELLEYVPEGVDVEVLDSESVVEIQYPVLEYPEKIKSFNLDKIPEVEGTLIGIKGQYLIFDTGVINMRKYAGYHLTVG